MTRRPIIVSVDEVRLHGFDSRARSTIGDALGRELTRLFEAGPAIQASRTIECADGGTFAVRRDASAGTLGAGIAARVYRAVRRPC